MASEKQKIARRKKNPENKSGYSGVLVHGNGVPCGSSSLYGVTVTKEKHLITCITCRRMYGLENK